MAFIKSCSIDSRNEQSPTCEVVDETNKAHFRNPLPNRFLPSSFGKALAWRPEILVSIPTEGNFWRIFFCSSLCKHLSDSTVLCECKRHTDCHLSSTHVLFCPGGYPVGERYPGWILTWLGVPWVDTPWLGYPAVGPGWVTPILTWPGGTLGRHPLAGVPSSWPGWMGVPWVGAPWQGYPHPDLARGVPWVGVPLAEVPPLAGPGWGTPPAGPGQGTPLWTDRGMDGWMDGWMDGQTHVKT